ncbi:MAG: hypothetical protein IPJ79_20740 [Bacteroidetes bacterium]|nr:hypothetical protein [Bacteroidota bacterium]
MKKIILILCIVLNIMPRFLRGQSQTTSVTPCVLDIVSTMNDLLDNVNTTSCYPNLRQTMFTLQESCGRYNCINPAMPRSAYMFINTSTGLSFRIFWPTTNTPLSNYTYYGLCIPAPGPVYPVSPPCLDNHLDNIELRVYDSQTNSLVNLPPTSMVEITNPHFINGSEPGCNLLNQTHLTIGHRAAGVVADVLCTDGSTKTAFFSQLYDWNANEILWKEFTPIVCEYNNPCAPVDLTCYDNSINIQLPNCPYLNVWYNFDPNGSIEGCDASISLTCYGNKIELINEWTGINTAHPCSTLGNPVFTIANLSNTFIFNSSQLPAGNNIIQVQIAGIQVPGQPNLYSYNIVADAYSGCSDCEELPCERCIGSFAPIPSNGANFSEYIISAWARKENAASTVTNFPDPEIIVSFDVGSPTTIYTSGPVIDGWQRIHSKCAIPANATQIKIELSCQSGNCLFDDVRVFPVNGMMKSYVYDPKSMRFVAELDEENYASFFEYDEEGKLTTVKKETVRGIMTIKESRSKVVKQ